ncbi:MAG: LamG domain-containing protein [Ferruginibacter sp.]|nr:LamG domain-containing protein [Ferruginibacter sp.]
MKKLFFLFLLITKICTAQTNLSQGLMAYYPFNGNAMDESGNNNNPVFNNVTLTADRLGNTNSAYHFNGVNSYIRVKNSPSLNSKNKISLSVWVRPTGFYYDICHASQILTKGSGNYLDGTYALRFDDALYTQGNGCSGDWLKDSLHMNFRGTGTGLQAYSPFIKKNTWYNLVYINDGDTAKLYVDCELKYAVAFKEIFTNNEDLFIGKMDDAMFPFWLHADVDDVRIYNRALSTQEIKLLCYADKKVEPKKPDTLIAKVDAKPIILEKRENKILNQVEVENDSITVTLYDNGIVDGDSVTLIYQNQILTTHQLLTDKGITFSIKVSKDAENNQLIMYAENLGSIPPNTALMVIYDGKKRHELNISSSKTSNGVISFKLKE